jgi:hypothetical protein
MGGDRGGYRIPEQEIERVLAEGPVPAGSDQNNEA